MFPLVEILQLIVQGIFSVFFEPLFWLILGLVGMQYYQMQKMQLNIFGVYGYTLKQQILWAVIYGGIGGIIGSVLLTFVGVSLNKLGFEYIWPLALALMLINMRFLCFAYAGGLIALSNVLFGWPDIDPPQILALVAVLHITESLLIAISGRYSAVPLLLKRSDGRVVGAFNLQNFWPLPLVMLFAISIPGGEGPVGRLGMPDWWPLLPVGQPPEGEEWLFVMMPIVAALGYTDVAVANAPSTRRRKSAFHLFIYSIVLLILAVLSAKYNWLQFIAALVSPLGHELLIRLDNRSELNSNPKYIPPDQGIMVLDTVSMTPARRIGIRTGDIIISLSGISVNSRPELAYAIEQVPEQFTIDFVRDGKFKREQGSFNGMTPRQLGLILVPEGYESNYVELNSSQFGLLDWIKRRFFPKKF